MSNNALEYFARTVNAPGAWSVRQWSVVQYSTGNAMYVLCGMDCLEYERHVYQFFSMAKSLHAVRIKLAWLRNTEVECMTWSTW